MGFLSGVGGFLGLGNPAKGARKYLEPIEGYGRAAYQPYIQQGQAVDPLLRERYDRYLSQEPIDTYGQMANDPTGLINAIMAQYAQSPAAQYQQRQMTQQAQNAARAGGYAGTMGDQRQQAELVQALSSLDMQQFLENVLGVKGAGLQGQQYLADKGLGGLENISNRGFEASTGLADYLGSAAAQRAGLEFGGRQSQMGNRSNLFGNLIGAGAGMYGSYQGRKGLEALRGAGGAPGSFA